MPAPGPTRALRGRLLHCANRDFGHLVRRLNDYAVASAGEKAARGERSGLGRALLHGGARFFKVYLLQGAILDGRRGLLMAVLYGVVGGGSAAGA